MMSNVACFVRCGSSSLASTVVFLPFVKGTHDDYTNLVIERRADGVFSVNGVRVDVTVFTT